MKVAVAGATGASAKVRYALWSASQSSFLHGNMRIRCKHAPGNADDAGPAVNLPIQPLQREQSMAAVRPLPERKLGLAVFFGFDRRSE